MLRITLLFATFSTLAMNTPPHKPGMFSEKPYLSSWPKEHSVFFNPELHKIPFLGLITEAPHVLALEHAAAISVNEVKNAYEIQQALEIQAAFGTQNAVPLFIAYCTEQRKITAMKKSQGTKKK